MSSGNTNYITLDSIAEIQDIVPSDFLFTISNGIVYKLDFQNFVVSLDNTDFANTIESLSATAVTLSRAFSAVNSRINSLSGYESVESLFAESSASWDSTTATVESLSSTCWLPQSNEAKPIRPGAIPFYNPTSPFSSKWDILNPGGVGDTIIVNNFGLPKFSAAAGGQSLVGGPQYLDLSGVMKITTRQRSGGRQDDWQWVIGEGAEAGKNAYEYPGYSRNSSAFTYVKYATLDILSLNTGTKYNNILLNYDLIPTGTWAGASDFINYQLQIQVQRGDEAVRTYDKKDGSIIDIGNNLDENNNPVPINVVLRYKVAMPTFYFRNNVRTQYGIRMRTRNNVKTFTGPWPGESNLRLSYNITGTEVETQ